MAGEKNDVAHRVDDDGEWIDFIGRFAIGVPQDIGWGIAVLNEDETVTRTCKSCGVVVIGGLDEKKQPLPVPVNHNAGCEFIATRHRQTSKRCVDCKVDYPAFMISEFFDSAVGYRPLCGICALDEVNRIHLSGRETFQPGSSAEAKRAMAVAYRQAMGIRR